MKIRHHSYSHVVALLSGLFFASCVSLDQLPPGAVPAAQKTNKADATFPDLEALHATVTSAHFTLQGYVQADLDALRYTAEDLFTKISSECGLYTFLSSQNFTIVVYKDKEDFLKKTNQPETSHVVTGSKTLYLYYTPQDIQPALAHHLAHVLLKSYMGDKLTTLKWLDEGFAMHAEIAQLSESERTIYNNSKASQLRQNRMAFSQMSFFATNSEEKRLTDTWYQQTESVVSYLLAQGSPLAFAQFLSELRVVEIDQAISDAYPAKFRSFTDLEAAWKYTI